MAERPPSDYSQIASALISGNSSSPRPQSGQIATILSPTPSASKADEAGSGELFLFRADYSPPRLDELRASAILERGTLNDAQWAAVVCQDNLVIVAVPGSGKTQVVSHKTELALLLSEKHKVAAVSFSKDAARKLDQRLRKMVRKKDRRRLQCKTFHGYVIKQLNQAGHKREIIYENEINSYIQRAMEVVGLHSDRFDEIRDKVNTARLQVGPSDDNVINEIIKAFEEIMASEKVSDFTGLIRLAVDLMKFEKLMPVDCTHLFCDEAQDVDPIQLEWILEHARRGVIVAVVGDDDQSIYEFREALGADGLRQLKSKLPDSKVVILFENYRSLENINEHAKKLIQNNPNRINKPVVSKRGKGGVIQFLQFESPAAEAKGIADAIYRRCVENTGGKGLKVGEEEFAVLARNNHQLEKIMQELRERDIPYVMKSNRIWEEDPVIYAICFLAVIYGLRFSGLTTTLHLLGIPQTIIKQLQARFGCNLKGIGSLKPEDIRKEFASEIEDRLVGFLRMFRRSHDLMVEGNDLGVANYVFRCFRAIVERAAKANRLNGRGLKEKIDKLEYASQTLQKSLGKSNLRSQLKGILLKPNSKKKNNAVDLMTLHSSKGLEYKVVFVVGANQENIPDPKSTLSEIPGERRLIYVGITRAMDEFYFSYTRTPSQFISEAGLKHA